MTEDEVQMHTTHPSFFGASKAFGALAQTLTAGAHDQAISACVLEDVKSLFVGESEIRVFIDGTKNLGHQAASLDLLRRLLDITLFRGDVVVLYADYGRALLGETAEKIGFLLQQTVGTSLESITFTHHGGARIRFVPYNHRKSLPRCARYGFSGGADDMGVNYAAELGVEWFLRLQPFLWDDEAGQKSDRYYESSRIETADGRMLYLVDAWPPLRELPLKRSNTVLKPAPMANAPGADVIKNLEQLGYVIWPIYGLHHFRSLSHIVAFNLAGVALLLSAQLGRPIALLSLCPIVEELSQSTLLAALTSNVSKVPTSAEPRANLDNPGLSTALDVMLDAIPRPARFDFMPPQMARSNCCHPRNRTEPAQAVMMQLGPLAPSVFERLLRSAPLPPVIEGQSTANVLLNFGRPYLHLLRPEHVIKNAYVSGVAAPGCSELASWMNSVAQSLLVLPSSDRPTAAENVAALVLRLSDPSSEEAKYFAGISRWLAKDEHDKLFLGLAALHHTVHLG